MEAVKGTESYVVTRVRLLAPQGARPTERNRKFWGRAELFQGQCKYPDFCTSPSTVTGTNLVGLARGISEGTVVVFALDSACMASSLGGAEMPASSAVKTRRIHEKSRHKCLR